MLAALGAQFLSRQLFRGDQGVNSADLHIRFHAFSFPVTFRYRVDRSAERDPNCEVISGGHTSHGMGATARRFAHDGAALLRLQIEGKFLPSRKGFVRSEYVDGLIDKAWSRNPGKCPVLVRLVVVAVGEIVDMGRLPEQIGNHKFDHTGIAAMIFAQVKDQGIGMRHKVRFCTTMCKSAHTTRLSEKRRIRSLWRPSVAPSAADSSCLDNRGHGGAEL